MGNSTSGPAENNPDFKQIRELLDANTETYFVSQQQQKGGSNPKIELKVNDIVKRKSRSNEDILCELTGKITAIVESHEWPVGSGKKLPTMYIINFPELFKGTNEESAKFAYPECDIELVYDSKFLS
jgi:hypothetical protein